MYYIMYNKYLNSNYRLGDYSLLFKSDISPESVNKLWLAFKTKRTNIQLKVNGSYLPTKFFKCPIPFKEVSKLRDKLIHVNDRQVTTQNTV